jgi:predicted AlkP superfamily phosphohydrolase/phosphomutase
MIHMLFAYIGPGAGFAFLGSFLTLLLSLAASCLSMLLWPFRTLWGMLHRSRGMRTARVKKLIFLGLDGLDPEYTEKLMAEGKLPNLVRLSEQGSYRRLRTTFPAVSSVAWSTFATGVNSAKHEPFWKILGRNAVESTILRVPVTFPLGEFDGRLLCAVAPPAAKAAIAIR